MRRKQCNGAINLVSVWEPANDLIQFNQSRVLTSNRVSWDIRASCPYLHALDDDKDEDYDDEDDLKGR